MDDGSNPPGRYVRVSSTSAPFGIEYSYGQPCIYRIFSNVIRTSFCRFLKRKKIVRGSNPHLWENDDEDKDDSDWVTDSDSVMSEDGESDE